MYEMGLKASEILLERLTKERKEPIHVIFKPILIERGSV
jgi:DNA-binding LacI/PurR family transcriptional regulator